MFLISQFFRRLFKDETGSILVFGTIMIVGMMGMVGLALDGSRHWAMSNELQDLADAAALAGARELDGEDDAIARATAAAQTLLNNNPHWAQWPVGSPANQIQSVVTRGPTSPDDTDGATDPRWARYITVTTVSRGVFPTILQAIGVTSNTSSFAMATAERTTVACKVLPLMLCNPMEPAPFTAAPGMGFWFKPRGNLPGNNTLAPGDFGLVDPPGQTTSGAQEVSRLLSKQAPNVCFGYKLNPRPGQVVNAVEEGINVRFDVVPKGNTTGMDLSPAPNVIDGSMDLPGGQCRLDPSGAVPLPFDDPWTNYGGVAIGLTGPTAGGRSDYWLQHHGSTSWPTDATSGQPMTRYQVYLKEIADGQASFTGPEPMAPQCSTSPAGSAARRVLSAAIIDCQRWNVQGNSVNDIVVNKYGDFFIVQPSPGPGSGAEHGTIKTEFIGFRPVGSGTDIHVIVRLVR